MDKQREEKKINKKMSLYGNEEKEEKKHTETTKHTMTNCCNVFMATRMI